MAITGGDTLPDAGAPPGPRLDAGAFERTMSARAATPRPGSLSLEASPIRIGRYTIIRQIGSGGMGDVYAAFDEQLDRKIAVKVLRDDRDPAADWKERMLREAQAMARLSHPNVITVHEIGEYGDQMFIAMEFVAGVTLETWLAAAPRRWQATVAMFVEAGRGLHAAHLAGIIHRDFKPTNVMIGDDGRVRVFDFGIAAPQQVEEGSELTSSSVSLSNSSSAAFSHKLTRDGTVLGTPLYMSPEQLADWPLTPASDQFNFCVALWDALFALHPFIDPPFTLHKLRARVLAGELREPPQGARNAPGWVVAALRRGLRPMPADRFPSMAELLAALSRDPARLRRRLLAPAALALAGLAGFALSANVEREVNRCDSGQAAMAGAWNPTRRAQVTAAFHATGLSFGDTVLASVTLVLDAYAGDWLAMHHSACVAHRDGEQSGAMLDLRMSCLDRSRQALEGALTLLAAADLEVVDGAVGLVHQLPRITTCGDIGALSAAVPPPDDPAVAAEVTELRRRLDAASALAAVGRGDEAATSVRAVVARSRELAYRPLVAESLLVEGRTLLDAFAERREVLPVFNEALVVALTTNMPAEAAEALARRAYIVGLETGQIDEALFNADLARELLRQLPTPGPLLGLLDNNIGAVHVAAGDRVQALAHFEAALANVEGLPGEHTIDLSNTLANVAIQLDEGPRRRELLARMVEIRREKLGEGHPFTAHGVILAGLYTTDPRAASELFERACVALDQLRGDRVLDRRQCRTFLGNARAEAGQPREALIELRRAQDLAVPDFDASTEGQLATATLRAQVALLAGTSAAALPELRRALAALEATDNTPWWRQLDLAELRLALAHNLAAAGDAAEAVALLDRVVPVLTAIARQRSEVAVSQRLAAAHLARARARLAPANGGESARSLAHADALLAEAWYRRAGAGYTWRLAELDRWRAEVEL